MSMDTHSTRFVPGVTRTQGRSAGPLSLPGQDEAQGQSRPVDAWLDWRGACQALGLSKSQFYRLVGAGELPAYRFGKRKAVRVRQSALKAFLRAHRLDLDELDPCDDDTECLIGLPFAR